MLDGMSQTIVDANSRPRILLAVAIDDLPASSCSVFVRRAEEVNAATMGSQMKSKLILPTDASTAMRTSVTAPKRSSDVLSEGRTKRFLYRLDS